MVREMNSLLPLGAAALGIGGPALARGPVAIALNVLCVLLAFFVVVRYVATLRGHDPWRSLRRERKRGWR